MTCRTKIQNRRTVVIALYNHGYRNVYELGPLIDFKQSKLPFEGTARSG